MIISVCDILVSREWENTVKFQTTTTSILFIWIHFITLVEVVRLLVKSTRTHKCCGDTQSIKSKDLWSAANAPFTLRLKPREQEGSSAYIPWTNFFTGALLLLYLFCHKTYIRHLQISINSLDIVFFLYNFHNEKC